MRTVKYYVHGGNLRSSIGQWWSSVRKQGTGSANFIVCKTKAHALRQYYKCKTKHRQLDVREEGNKKWVWKYRNSTLERPIDL